MCIGEIATHLFLSQYGLAPPLLARFENGLLCQFVCGKPCEEQDLYSPPVFCAVASHLAHWHAVLPSTGPSWLPSNGHTNTAHSSNDSDLIQIRTKPSIWTVLQDWIDALPVETHTQHSNRLDLQKELQWIVGEFDGKETIGENGVCCTFFLEIFPFHFSCCSNYLTHFYISSACVLARRSYPRKHYHSPG